MENPKVSGGRIDDGVERVNQEGGQGNNYSRNVKRLTHQQQLTKILEMLDDITEYITPLIQNQDSSSDSVPETKLSIHDSSVSVPDNEILLTESMKIGIKGPLESIKKYIRQISGFKLVDFFSVAFQEIESNIKLIDDGVKKGSFNEKNIKLEMHSLHESFRDVLEIAERKSIQQDFEIPISILINNIKRLYKEITSEEMPESQIDSSRISEIKSFSANIFKTYSEIPGDTRFSVPYVITPFKDNFSAIYSNFAARGCTAKEVQKIVRRIARTKFDEVSEYPKTSKTEFMNFMDAALNAFINELLIKSFEHKDRDKIISEKIRKLFYNTIMKQAGITIQNPNPPTDNDEKMNAVRNASFSGYMAIKDEISGVGITKEEFETKFKSNFSSPKMRKFYEVLMQNEMRLEAT